MTFAVPTPVGRQFPVIRVFVSSTFSDLVAERNALADRVWPKLEQYCRQRGFTFQAIDLRWGVPGEAGLDHRTMQICFEELRRAQETSPKPNFLILLGNKYGWRPLPETVSEDEYSRLHELATFDIERHTLATWYRREANALPFHHVLRARTDSPDGQDYTRVPDGAGRLVDTPAWQAVQETLWRIVNRAYPSSCLRQRFTQGDANIPAGVRFQGSATEQEIWHGALRVESANEHVIAYYRSIDRSGGDPPPSKLKQFLDLRPDHSPDTEATGALDQLKDELERKLGSKSIVREVCRWERGPTGEFTGNVTTEHLISMCDSIHSRLQDTIEWQINDYWGLDLSAPDATVATVRGSAQELALEVRDHNRFAQERGPVDLFVGRDEQVRGLREYLLSKINRPLVVHGPSGSGKTALLAYVTQQPFTPDTETQGVSPIILTRFIGAHPESSTLRGLMTSLCRELRNHFPIIEKEGSSVGNETTVLGPLPDTLHKLTEEFYTQLGRATASRPIFVFLDALDQLEAADQARHVAWFRSQLVRDRPELSGCHARVVASCLSPSTEFPLESEACEPFRQLQSRGLLAGEELGALDVSAARQLVRSWLAAAQRVLTDQQWQSVDAALANGTECRRPLYLKVLSEELRRWREFDPPRPIPPTLSELLQQALTRLSESIHHGPLPRIALGYLVSARYGLSEGELLEILYRDPEIKDHLDASRRDYGHELPPGTWRYPIAPWARLRADFRPYLSERSAPGTTVLHCYHRQVEHVVRTMFLADEETCTDRCRRLADYFDSRWDEPDAHALIELPSLLLAVADYQRLYDSLTNFAFPMRRAEVGLLESIPDDYRRLAEQGPSDIRQRLDVWQDFFREQAHILRRGLDDGTCHKILLQLALEHADDSPVTQAAEAWLEKDRCDWFRLQRVNRFQHTPRNACRLVLEGHAGWISGALPLPDSKILSFSADRTLRLWDAISGDCLAVLKGHTGIVTHALSISGCRILTWLQGGAVGYPNDSTPRLWDTETRVCCAALKGHTEQVLGALSLSDSRILTWSEDTTLRLWDAETGACSAVLEGHLDAVDGAMPLPNGRILSWSRDYTLRLWEAASGRCTAVLNNHSGPVASALLLPDGRIVSWSTTNENTLRLWDAATGAYLAGLEGHDSSVKGALPLPNGRILSWGDKTLRLWDAANGICTAVLVGHTDWIIGAITISNCRILSWSNDKTLRLWDANTGVCYAVLVGHTGFVWKVLSLPDNRIVSWENKTLRLWDTETGACCAVLEGHLDDVVGALPLTNGRILSWSWDTTLRLWDAETGTCCAVLEGHTSCVKGAQTLSDGRILSWSRDGTLRLWDASTRVFEVQDRHTRQIEGAMLLPGGRIVSWSSDTTMRLWNAANGACYAVLEGHTSFVKDVQTLPDCRILSWSSTDTSLRLWDVASGICTAILVGHTDRIIGAITLSNCRILSWSKDTTLRLWDANTGVCYAVLVGHMGPVWKVLLLSDRQILAWSLSDKTLRLWDTETGVCQTAFEGHTSFVEDALPLPDGRILSWSRDYTLRLWDAGTGACDAVLDGHTSFVRGAQLLPDGRILSWSWDQTLRLWDTQTGVCQTVLEGHTSFVEDALPLPDGRILSWSQDYTLRLWDAGTGACDAVLDGHTSSVRGAQLLLDGRILSWSECEEVFRLWDGVTGGCLDVVAKDDLAICYPDCFHHKRLLDDPMSVAGDWCVDAAARTALLLHRLGLKRLYKWQAESRSEAHVLQADGTLVVTQDDGQVCFVKLYHGRRRVSLDEAAELLGLPSDLPGQ